MGKGIGLFALAVALVAPGVAAAQGFSGPGAAGYAQSQGWTASAGVRPNGADVNPGPVGPGQGNGPRRASHSAGRSGVPRPAAQAR